MRAVFLLTSSEVRTLVLQSSDVRAVFLLKSSKVSLLPSQLSDVRAVKYSIPVKSEMDLFETLISVTAAISSAVSTPSSP